MCPHKMPAPRGPFSALLFPLLLLCVTAVPTSAQQSAPQAPILRIETGMHGALVGSLGTDAKNTYVVTGSNDKTVRVWDGATGTALRVIRPPIGEGTVGQIFAVALSPDGSAIACGGWTGDPAKKSSSVDLFDRATGQMTRRMDGLPNVINALAFSPKGDYLAAVLGSGGLRVFSTANGAVVGEDAKYPSDSYGVAWAQAGGALRLATTCFDRSVRLYEVGGGGQAALRPVARITVQGNVHPFGAAFSPDGAKLAVGFYDARQVLVLSGADLNILYSPDSAGVANGSLPTVCWSADGQDLYAGGKYQQPEGFVLRRWADGGKGAASDTPLSSGTLLGLQARRAGGVFFCAGDPAWGAVGGDNQTLFRQEPRLADFRDDTDTFQVSSNGSTVRFGTGRQGKTPAQFSLVERAYQSGGAAAGNATNGLAAPVTQAPGLDVQNWRDGRSPTLGGKPLALKNNELARCLAVAPGGRRFVLGTEWNVRCFDTGGQPLWSVTAPGTTWAVNVTPNGKATVAAFGDGTIRWFRLSDGQELCALFPHRDGKRWVLWTPGGYYDCSPGGEDLIGWHLNHGPDQAADFFSASRFRNTYYRPTVLAKVLDALGETEALRQADAETGRKPAPAALGAALPPVVTVLVPSSGASVSSGTVTFRYSLRTPSGQPVLGVRALVDGRPALADRDLRLVAADTSTAKGATREITIPVPPRDCVVSLVAVNGAGASEPALVSLVWTGAPPSPQSTKPRLFVLAVGISQYKDAGLSLTYPDKDAKGFAATLQAQKGRLYADVQQRVLLNGEATREKIRDGLAWLGKQTTARDVAVIFLAGHGANDLSGRYLFIPADFDRDRFAATGVPFSDIKNTVESLPGKTLLFVDSCHSGNVLGTRQTRGLTRASWAALCPAPRPKGRGVDVTGAINELSSAENGAVVFAASTGNQVALEDPAWGHGAFTKALLEAFAGKADYTHRGRITVNMLDLYLSDRVKELTEGAQTPTTAKPQTVPDFPVALSGPR